MNSNKKAGLHYQAVLGIIIGLVGFLIIFSFLQNMFESSNYDSSLIECKQFMSRVDGLPAFFGEDLDEPNSKLQFAIEENCPSKTIKVSEKSVNNAAQLISQCWNKFSKEDFMGEHSKEKGLVIYCGEIQGKNEKDFSQELLKELNNTKYDSLKEDTETNNMNEYFLFETLKSKNYVVDNENSLGVYFYIYKPYKQDSWVGATENYWGIDVTPTLVDYYVGETENPSNSAVVLKPIKSGTNPFSEKESIYGITIIIPQKNYE
ncbi:MAG: hypothetical protein ACOCXG_05235 [Nanoarchaeota archaeon]